MGVNVGSRQAVGKGVGVKAGSRHAGRTGGV